jgi:RES domain-containing protein
VLQVTEEHFPRNWATAAAIPKTQALGDDWVKSGASAILAVPSAVISQETNYVLNPKHPKAVAVKTGEPETFLYDPRVLKGSTA